MNRILWILFLSLFSINSWAIDFYVSPSGSDNNSGSSLSPLRTIQKAANLATPGTTVYVAPGTYTESIYSTKSGTSSARIRFISTTKWGAKIVPPSSGRSTAFDNRGSYVDIEGFEIDGQSKPLWNYGIYSGGSYSSIKSNHVHHLGTSPTCSSHGGAGIGNDYYYYGEKIDVIGNVVHHIGSSTCNYIQGLYIATSGQIKNNLVYAIGAVGIHLWHDARDIVIANNTLFNTYTAILVGGGEYYHISGPTDYIHVSNNIVFDNVDGIKEHGTTGRNNTYTNNLVYNNKVNNWKLQNGLTHSGTVSADPQFVNYVRTGGGDYQLRSTSPGIDKGSVRYAPPTDIDGKARPQGLTVDIGAYEFIPSTPSPAPAPAPAPTPAPSPAPAPAVTVTQGQFEPGATIAVQVTGSGTNAEEYVALYLEGSADSQWSYKSNWQYLNGTKTAPISPYKTATLKFTAPQEPGVYNFRLLSSDNFSQAGNRLAESRSITVSAPGPKITLSQNSFTPGSAIKFQISGMGFHRAEWVGLYKSSAPDLNGIYNGNWAYLNGLKTAPSSPMSSATMTFKAPMEPGTYNLRLFGDNTYSQRVAISVTITVSKIISIHSQEPDQYHSYLPKKLCRGPGDIITPKNEFFCSMNKSSNNLFSQFHASNRRQLARDYPIGMF